MKQLWLGFLYINLIVASMCRFLMRWLNAPKLPFGTFSPCGSILIKIPGAKPPEFSGVYRIRFLPINNSKLEPDAFGMRENIQTLHSYSCLKQFSRLKRKSDFGEPTRFETNRPVRSL